MSYIWEKTGLTTLDTESNIGECKHQCNLLGDNCQAISWDSGSQVPKSQVIIIIFMKMFLFVDLLLVQQFQY